MHEESVRGTLAELTAHFKENEPRGEFVIIVEGAPEKKAAKRRNNHPTDGETPDEKAAESR